MTIGVMQGTILVTFIRLSLLGRGLIRGLAIAFATLLTAHRVGFGLRPMVNCARESLGELESLAELDDFRRGSFNAIEALKNHGLLPRAGDSKLEDLREFVIS